MKIPAGTIQDPDAAEARVRAAGCLCSICGLKLGMGVEFVRLGPWRESRHRNWGAAYAHEACWEGLAEALRG